MGYHASINCNLLGDLRKKKKTPRIVCSWFSCFSRKNISIVQTKRLVRKFSLTQNQRDRRRLPVTFLNSPTYKPHPIWLMKRELHKVTMKWLARLLGKWEKNREDELKKVGNQWLASLAYGVKGCKSGVKALK